MRLYSCSGSCCCVLNFCHMCSIKSSFSRVWVDPSRISMSLSSTSVNPYIGGRAWSQLPGWWTPWNMRGEWPYGGWIPGGPKGLKFCRKLDVPKGNWDWGVGGENWPLPSDEYWDGESWFKRFEMFLGLGSIGRWLCSRVESQVLRFEQQTYSVFVQVASRHGEEEANAQWLATGAYGSLFV